MNKNMLLTGIMAYTIWGCFPLFFAQLAHITPLEVISGRIFWSFIFCCLLMFAFRQWRQLKPCLTPSAALWSLVAALLISTNWLIFVYAVAQKQVIQSSLGYFLTPLVSVFLARFILGERLRPLQRVSIALAVLAVIWEMFRIGELPWISLVLALSFGLYGLVRKKAPFETLQGLLLETGWMFLPSLGYLIVTGSVALGTAFVTDAALVSEAASSSGTTPSTDTLMMILSGIVTAVPLLLFSSAARGLPLTVIGFIMYINPTMQFLTAVFLFNEPFPLAQWVAFSLIWVAVALFCYDLYHSHRRQSV